MGKIKVSETGEVDIRSVQSLSRNELRRWIDRRLHGKDVEVPLSFRQDDPSYYLISLIYPKLKRSVREEIRGIVSEFLRDMARNLTSNWRREAGHQLLLLAQFLHLEEAVDLVIEMAAPPRFFDAEECPKAEDLHYRVLQTLVALGYRGDPEFWYEQVGLDQVRYVGIAFDGMALISPECAVDLLTQIIWDDEAEEMILSSLPDLVEEYGIACIASLVEDSLRRMSQRTQGALRTFFIEEGCPLKSLIPRSSNYEPIHLVVLRKALFTITIPPLVRTAQWARRARL